MLDLAHVGRLRVAIEELPHRLAGVVTGLVEGLSHETIAGAVLRAMIAHPVRQLTRGPAIAATPYKAMPIKLVRFRSGQVRSNPLLQRKRRATAPRSTPFPHCLAGPGAEGAFRSSMSLDNMSLLRGQGAESGGL